MRSNESKRVRNKYQHKTTRNALRAIRAITDKAEASKLYPSVASMIDRLAKNNVIHDNKAANLKSGLQVMINKL
ncbi:MAG: 30S ribosomal protein S20 [Crocinitomicaceae bacterium]|nr:30S ribosomal protein S20 [Crocinitomicaceae bacterium]